MSAAQANPNPTGGRMLASNAIWNLLGQFLPMAAAVVAIPVVIHGLGVPRFGVLSLVWILIGYFGLFDFGISRATTKLVAETALGHHEQGIVPLVWTSLVLMSLLGVIGAGIMLAICPWLVHRALKIPSELRLETLHGCYLMAACIPFITLTAGLRGALEGLQHFRVINLIRIPMSVFSFAGPLLVLPFSHSLFWVIAILVFGRVIACFIHFVVCLAVVPALQRKAVFETSLVKPVVIFGGWMTVSNVISPILVYVDRFVLGAMISTSVIAYYTVPFDVVTRLTLAPGAVAGVLFPAFALTLVQDPQRAQRLLDRSLIYIFATMFPIALVVVALGPECLKLWLGPTFAQKSTSVLRWLTIGVLINSLAHVPFALVQSAGRADITAKLHILELPVYALSVWLLTKHLGIEGTAIAWTGRLVLDALLIGWVLQRMVWRHSKHLFKLGGLVAAGLLLLYAATLFEHLGARLAFVTACLAGFGLLAGLRILNRGESMMMFLSSKVRSRPSK